MAKTLSKDELTARIEANRAAALKPAEPAEDEKVGDETSDNSETSGEEVNLLNLYAPGQFVQLEGRKYQVKSVYARKVWLKLIG